MNWLAIFLAGFTAALQPTLPENRATFDELRFAGVVRQAADPSCGTASIVTLLRMRFGEAAPQGDLWLDYLATLPEDKRTQLLSQGLSIGDISRLLRRMNYRASAVRIGLFDLARTGEPAIVHLQRDGVSPFRHFAVFERLDGVTVVLRDPAYGTRRIHISAFLRYWSGIAVFVNEAPKPN